MWLEHHGCEVDKNNKDNKISENDLSLVDDEKQEPTLISIGLKDNQGELNIETEKPYDPNDPCQNIPEGHPADMWLIHNDCL